MGPPCIICLIFCILKSGLKIKVINFKNLKDLNFLKKEFRTLRPWFEFIDTLSLL